MRNIDKNTLATFMAYAAYLMVLLRMYKSSKRPSQEVDSKYYVRKELMEQIENNDDSRSLIRMTPQAFKTLVNILKHKKLLKDNNYSCVEEQVAKCLWILGRNESNSIVKFIFRRSGETVSRHFHHVLKAIISLEDDFLVQPDGSTIPSEILHSGGRFYPYFKNCVGAIDGTHVRVKVLKEDASRYRGRKGIPTMNIIAACSFDLKFTYVLPGWEGSASDSRILENSLTREDKLKIPKGKFYLVDAGYPLRSGLITPYRSTRYHLKEYSISPPENAKELFNLRHASLRNAIERAFGVVNKRFPIIASGAEAQYDVDTVSEIVLACCILHNFLLMYDPDDDLLRQVDSELLENSVEYQEIGSMTRDADAKEGEQIRDRIASHMWHD
ncbi:uncharacterized protein LOC126675554 [Mercurialis annua]|uniref:uncharacterized protein LOC126675554 n=1 Tax=Mercurialis annua TaxID=3986 RepID=UPI00215FCA13|nr:uncharacterized protein LOC126675554 [Mercurialis annua]